MIVQYLKAEALDALIEATRFNLGESSYEYKYKWLLERINILTDDASKYYTLLDNPTVHDLLLVIEGERRLSAALKHNIASLHLQLDYARKGESNMWKKGPMPKDTYNWGGAVVKGEENGQGFFFADFHGDHVILSDGRTIDGSNIALYNNCLELPPKLLAPNMVGVDREK